MSEAPKSLLKIQQAFSKSIRTPLELLKSGYRTRTEDYDTFIVNALMPRKGKTKIESLEIYNKQYWFRLITLMQEEMPLLCQLLGLRRFNLLTMDYLHKNPSNHPELRKIFEGMPSFIHENETWGESKLEQAATLDTIYQRIFYQSMSPSLELSRLSPEKMADMLSQPLTFQPLDVFAEDWNLVETRKGLRRENELEDKSSVSLKPGSKFWCIYRNADGIKHAELEKMEFMLLKNLHEGLPLHLAFENLGAVLDKSEMENLENGIQSWFQKWAELGFFRDQI